jgi:anti-sigma factor RsiW
MQYESHARARFLLDQAVTGGISPDEQRWLDSHTEECAECSRYCELSKRAIRALDSFAFEIDPVSALRVENAIRSRANRLALNEFHSRRTLVGATVAMFLTIAGSIAMWQPAAWLAGRWSLPTPGWQIGFAMFWILPSALLGMLPYFRRLMGDDSGTEGRTV